MVIAAGNQMKDLDDPKNLVYPPCFETDNNLVVAELALDGKLDQFSGNDRVSGSNYGLRRVHIAAFGTNFTSHVQDGFSVYGMTGGTSNAAPVVTGVAALVLSVRPQLKARELKQILMESSTKVPALEGKIASGGLVDAYRAVKLAMSR
jgi:subtilisin family serine protease